TKNFYRHPKRQGISPQDRYEPKHDVYSLGVCLLEFGLWESFIVEEDGEPALSKYFLDAAEEHAGCPPSKFGDFNRPQGERYSKMTPLCCSYQLKDVFVKIAEARLPQHMGTDFTEKVVRCLSNVEDFILNDIMLEERNILE
ncbi:hypothetical protein M501DRAFT_925468, partial [Patellaria atrata CBS 101060]